jgi:hypothetical protein
METNDEQLTVEQASVKIAEAQALKAKIQADLSEQERTAQEHRENSRKLNFGQTFLAGIGQSGIRFHADPEDLEKVFPLTGFTLRSSADGRQIQALDEDGRDVGLVRAFEKVALKYPNFVKDDTASHLKPRDAQGAYKTLAKSDFKTYAAKAEYIRNEGIEKWEAMPLYSTRGIETNVDKIDAEDWKRMPSAQKSQLISEYGQDIVSQILSRRRKS